MRKYNLSKEMTSVINEIYSQISGEAMFYVCNPYELQEIIREYMRKSNTGLSISRNSYLVDNGYLYINGDPAARITIKNRNNSYDDESYCTEGRILARQEAF